MYNKWSIWFVCFTCAFSAQAQPDKWTGVWKTSTKLTGISSPILMELNIGTPDQGMLYPATIRLQFGRFKALYEVLLAKKNDHQLGIGRSKFPLEETPYKPGIWMWYLNGTLDYHHNKLSLHRMWIDKFDIWMRGLYDGDEIFVHSKVLLREFLYRDSITLIKAAGKPPADSIVRHILYPAESKRYFGLYEQISTHDSVITMRIDDQEQYDRDTVTLLHNGKAIFTREQITDKNRELQVKLDTGRNIFIYFADNYGSLPPNTGLLRTTIAGKDYEFNFSTRSNAYATFLAADIYRQPGQAPAATRKAVPLITLPVDTGDIILEVRDTKVQDGDSISLQLNGEWIVRGLPVKTAVQEIKIRLQRGENVLLFMADNLGSIPPNTAELKIKYGRKSKTLGLSTDMKKNNEIRLVLE